MIAWKARVGYSTNPTSSLSSLQLSDFIFTDDTPIFSLATNHNLEATSVNLLVTTSSTSSFDNRFNDPIEGVALNQVATILESLLGKDYFYFSPILGKSASRYASDIFSTSFLYSSALRETLRNLSYVNFSIMHIPGLKRYIICQTSSTGLATQIRDENFNVVLASGGPFYPVCNGSKSFFLIYNGDGSDSSYSSIENYLGILTLNRSGIDPSDSCGYTISSYNSSAPSSYKNLLQAMFSDYSPPDYVEIVNPYDPIDPSGPTDPDLPPGTFDFDSDPIPDSPLPTLSAANTGFTRIYNPSLAQVQSLARYLWTDESLLQTLWNHVKQYFEDAMQAFIGFNLVPCEVPNGGTEDFAVLFWKTGVQLTVAANQFVDVDCGTVELKRAYRSALDQSPYTKVHCYLPYIGNVQLNTDEVMGTTLQVKYRIDIVSGSCVAKIFVDGNVLYQYSGHCAITIPFNSADFSSYVNAAIAVAKLGITAGAAAIGGALAGAAAEEATQQTERVVRRVSENRTTQRNPTTGRQVTMSTSTTVNTTTYPPQEENSSTQASFAGLSPVNISNTVGQIMSSKPNILHTGSFSGNSGYLGVRRPYLIIERPNMCLPASFQSMNGYPSMMTMVLGECVGYTRVQQVQLTGMWATNPEQAEILQLLKSGVIF